MIHCGPITLLPSDVRTRTRTVRCPRQTHRNTGWCHFIHAIGCIHRLANEVGQIAVVHRDFLLSFFDDLEGDFAEDLEHQQRQTYVQQSTKPLHRPFLCASVDCEHHSLGSRL